MQTQRDFGRIVARHGLAGGRRRDPFPEHRLGENDAVDREAVDRDRQRQSRYPQPFGPGLLRAVRGNIGFAVQFQRRGGQLSDMQTAAQQLAERGVEMHLLGRQPDAVRIGERYPLCR